MFEIFFKRALAYFIDMMLISVVVNSIVLSPVNIQLDKYNEYSKKIKELNILYAEQTSNDLSTCDDIVKAVDEEKITEEYYVLELEELKESLEKEDISKEDYDSKCLSLVEKYNSSKISEKEYVDTSNDYYHKIIKNSIFIYIVNMIACLLYFVFFQGFTNGQTLGKKLMRVKIVSDNDQKISYKTLFIRSLFLYDIVYAIGIMIIACLTTNDTFVSSYNILYVLNIVYSTVLVFMVGITGAKGGLHDKVVHTRVIEIDFKGNEIKRKSWFSKNEPEEVTVEEKESKEKKRNKTKSSKMKK